MAVICEHHQAVETKRGAHADDCRNLKDAAALHLYFFFQKGGRRAELFQIVKDIAVIQGDCLTPHISDHTGCRNADDKDKQEHHQKDGIGAQKILFIKNTEMPM